MIYLLFIQLGNNVSGQIYKDAKISFELFAINATARLGRYTQIINEFYDII